MVKNTIKYFLTITAFSILVAISACRKLCNEGYEGSRCNVLDTTKFIGQWNAVDTPGNLIYVDTISQGPVLGNVILSVSFAGHHFSHVINASIEDTIITVPYQQPDSANNFVQGTGSISADKKHISFAYQLISGIDSQRVIINYGGNWTKQN